jgi:hypothetical protein
MTEYVPDDHHGDGHEHDVTPHVDLPDHPDDAFSEHHLPPLDDLPPAHAPVPDELHFPGDGDDAGHDPSAHADLDPSAPFSDDDGFSDWLGGPEHADDPSADAELRDQLAAPPDDASGLPSSDELVDWTLRNLES